MADAATQTLERLQDRTQWAVREAVPIFVAHTEVRKLKNGQTQKFTWDKNWLESEADRLNRSELIDGNPTPLSIGHHFPNVKEADLGATVGFGRTYRVAPVGPKKLPGLVCDEYRMKDQSAEADKYPHRSVEIDPKTRQIERICLIKRTPRLPLGSVLPVLNFQADGCSMLAYSAAGDGRLFYSLDDQTEDPMNEELKAALDAIMGRLDKIEGKPAPKARYQRAVDDDDNATLIYSKADLDEALAEERKSSAANLKRLEVRLAKVEQDGKEEKMLFQRRSELDDLATVDGIELDVAEELEVSRGMDDAAWEKHVGRIKKNYQREERRPGTFIRMADAPSAGSKKVPTREQVAKVNSLRTANPALSFDDALKQIG